MGWASHGEGVNDVSEICCVIVSFPNCAEASFDAVSSSRSLLPKGVIPFCPKGSYPFAQGGYTLLLKGVVPFCLKGGVSFCLKRVVPFCLKGERPFWAGILTGFSCRVHAALWGWAGLVRTAWSALLG